MTPRKLAAMRQQIAKRHPGENIGVSAVGDAVEVVLRGKGGYTSMRLSPHSPLFLLLGATPPSPK